MTSILTCSDAFEDIGPNIRDGKTVIYPTDTVFGLGSNPESEIGVDRCFALKERDPVKPMPVLFSNLSKVEEYVELDSRCGLLSQEFWPGQLTLVLPLKRILPQRLTSGARKLAVRIPDHECTLRLIKACGGSLIGTSANISGEKAFLDPEDHGLIQFSERVDFLVKGRCGGKSGVSSTIVELSSGKKASLIREGAIPFSSVQDLLHER